MRKLTLLFLLSCIFLSGCSKTQEEYTEHLTQSVETIALSNDIAQTNMNKELYSYYLPKDVGRIESHEISSVLIKDGVKFIMNFNPNNIVINDFYDSTENHNSSAVETKFNNKGELVLTGSFVHYDHNHHNFRLYVDDINDEQVVFVLNCDFVFFYSICQPLEVEKLAKSMLIIAKSMRFDAQEVINAYSLKSTSESVKQSIDQYNEEFPDSGYISDLLEGNK